MIQNVAALTTSRLRNIEGVEPRPVHAVDKCGELRGREPHDAITDRRPAEGAVLEPFPEQHQPGPVPGQDLQTIRSLRAEDVDRPRERIMLELLAHQRSEAIGSAAEVHRLGSHQHPYAGRNRNHVAAFTARSTVAKAAASVPGAAHLGATRTAAAASTRAAVQLLTPSRRSRSFRRGSGPSAPP